MAIYGRLVASIGIVFGPSLRGGREGGLIIFDIEWILY